MNNELQSLLDSYPDLKGCVGEIDKAFTLLLESYRTGGKYLICGNGGSAADSEHIVGELMKGFKLKRPIEPALHQRFFKRFGKRGNYIADHLQGAIPAISLVSQHALITAFANDVGADMVFAQQVFGYGNARDVLIGISTSGNSENIINAIMVAKELGIHTIGLTGKDGGQMKAYCDTTICVPYEDTPRIQERHLPIYHALCIMLEKEIFSV
ncbi:D-sedoheptulose-7-phosphate isomerase [Bacillus sp. T33-2]|uniref:D-sedoheptulose-7-phosphate isomerase n=1 Tax=Bacillus sp. T33-2 TaxID=2054168 RepID=UPI000C7768D4|nr:SIS domain-containing protein [Bacillus sp. T33-2]PLR94684.1 phosphoheptose isomerase [Bacillus sp. T33-2]